MSSFAANQSKTEPHPPGAGDGQTETPGEGDPQAPSLAGSVPAIHGDLAPGTSEELPVIQGVRAPDLPETEPRT